MQHLGAERRELCRLLEADLLDEPGLGHDPGIGGEHPIHIGPDLDRFGAQRRTDERGGIVGPAATERRRDAGGGRPEEATHYGQGARLHERHDRGARAFLDPLEERRGLAELVVGDDHLARIHRLRWQAAGAKGRRHELRRELLAHGDDHVLAARRHVAEHRECFGEAGQLVDHGAHVAAHVIAVFRREEQPARVEVTLANGFHAAQRADELTAPRLVGDGEQLVGDAGQRGDDDDRVAIEARAHNVRGAADRIGVLDRGAAELENDHGRRPRATMSSALSIDAPAAPRMVLCPEATSRTSSISSDRMRPTVTVIPRPASASRFGCGRSAASCTTSTRDGALGSDRASGSPCQAQNAARTSSGEALDAKPTDMHAV